MFSYSFLCFSFSSSFLSTPQSFFLFATYLGVEPFWYTKYAPVAGALAADVAAISLAVPVDVIVQRMQLPNSRYTSARQALRTIWKEEGEFED